MNTELSGFVRLVAFLRWGKVGIGAVSLSNFVGEG